jgi:hypothetical protein
LTDQRFRLIGCSMDLITTTSELAAVCGRLASHPVITVDTEFLRETTYYPLLCVVQMASAEEAVVVDTLAEGIDLKPFFALMANEKVLKAIPSPMTSWSSASPVTARTRPTASPTGRAGR